MILILALTTFTCLLLGLWYTMQIRRKYINKIPGPPINIFTGNAHEFGSTIVDIFQNTRRIFKKYGPTVRIWQGPFRLNIFLSNPDHAEYFLSSTTQIKKSSGYDLFVPWFGHSLINSTGEKWKKHRRILTPAFHFKILEQFSDFFRNESETLIEMLKHQDGKTIDIYPYIIYYAMDTLCASSMCIKANCQKNSGNKYISANKVFLEIFLRRFFSILRRYDFFFWFTKDYKPYNESIKTMHSITRNIIQNRREELKHARKEADEDEYGIKKKKRVFLDVLLENNELTDEEIRNEVDAFMFAGHDTITSAISFAIYEIAKHLDVQKKILEEIHGIVGEDRTCEISFNQLKSLTYLDRAVKEAMRLFPPVPQIERELVEDVVLDGLRIPQGSTVSIHPYTIHRNEKLFPDPEKFDPDRFLPENTINRHPFAYIPFSAGPRNCIGQKYAIMNVKTTIANIVRNFELYPSEVPHIPVIGNDAIMKSVNGLPIKLVYRK